jgi:hypothetical protein
LVATVSGSTIIAIIYFVPHALVVAAIAGAMIGVIWAPIAPTAIVRLSTAVAGALCNCIETRAVLLNQICFMNRRIGESPCTHWGMNISTKRTVEFSRSRASIASTMRDFSLAW